MKSSLRTLLHAVLNSYSALFFSQNRVLAVLLLCVSFFQPAAGASGLCCIVFSLALMKVMGFNREHTYSGLYSFNNLLLGIGFGTFYAVNASYCVWLITACLLTTVLSVILSAFLGKYNLPVLSLPFILVFWAVLIAFSGYPGIGPAQKTSSLLNEIDATGLPAYPALFFRSLSSIIFQDSVAGGILLALGLLIHSRITFSLLLTGFVAACIFNSLTGAFPGGVSHYHLGANFMMTSCAIGGFFLIPSVRSYLWALASVPLAFLVVISTSHLAGVFHLPVFSLPFSLTTLALLYFFMLRVFPGKLNLTPVQHYSPEKNLYQFRSKSQRLFDLNYFNFSLPFLGAWTVSQGYDGNITHKGEWGKALDFVLSDGDGNTYWQPGTLPEHFYCYNKPVLAPADGTVEEVVNHIEDNPIGEVNTSQNWGNTIVIKHLTGLYTKLSHLKKGSVKVKPGEFVRQGDLIALCGNSGRSPEPHLHFQVQATPYIGSRTISYPFAYFSEKSRDGQQVFKSFSIPDEGKEISRLDLSQSLKQAFALPPGYIAVVAGDNGERETWEVFTDAYNTSYIFCEATRSTAWFVNNGTLFYFTHFSGDRRSLLYYFYLAAFKVIFSTDDGISAQDTWPLDEGTAKAVTWLNDLTAPFYNFIRKDYNSAARESSGGPLVRSTADELVAGKKTRIMNAEIRVSAGALSSFTIDHKGKKINARWTNEN